MGRTYIVAVGYAGAYKAADIIVEHEKELRSRYRSSFVDNMMEIIEEDVFLDGIRKAWYMPNGYLGALYELAEDRKCGIRVRLRQVPVMQSTIEVCELYGLNPYMLPTYAGLCLTDDPEHLIEGMDKPYQEMAACVGYLTDGHDKLIVDKTNVEYINKPRG